MDLTRRSGSPSSPSCGSATSSSRASTSASACCCRSSAGTTTERARADQHDRPGLGRQRGLAARRRRRDVRGVPGVVRHAVQRLLPAAAADPGRADRARRRVRVPRQARRRRAGARRWDVGDRRRLAAAGAAVGRRVRATSCAACRSTPTRSYTGSFFDLLNPYALLGGARPRCRCSSLHGAMFLALKTDGADPRARARAGRRLSASVAAVVAVVFLLWTLVERRAASSPSAGSCLASCSPRSRSCALVAGILRGARGLGLPRHRARSLAPWPDVFAGAVPRRDAVLVDRRRST